MFEAKFDGPFMNENLLPYSVWLKTNIEVKICLMSHVKDIWDKLSHYLEHHILRLKPLCYHSHHFKKIVMKSVWLFFFPKYECFYVSYYNCEDEGLIFYSSGKHFWITSFGFYKNSLIKHLVFLSCLHQCLDEKEKEN